MNTAEEYEAAFHGIELPKGPVSLGPGASIPDVSLFLEKQLTILKLGTSERVKEPVRWRLNRLLEIINEAN
ncbi:DUF6965 family protein [Pedobacter panaciterrae]